jgi:hypothetical protein
VCPFNRQALRDPAIRATLQRVLELAPNHLPAKHLLAQASNTAPTTLSVGATLYELSVIAFPYQKFLSGRDQVDRGSLSAATTASARRRLNTLRRIANKDAWTLIADMSSYVDKAEAVAAKTAKPAELDERRGTLMSHLSAMSVNREVMEKLVREGY